MLKLFALSLLPALSLSSPQVLLQSSSTIRTRTRLLSRAVRFTRGRFSKNRRGPVEQLETWQDSGACMKSSLSDDHLVELATSITAETYGQELHQLVDNKFSRFVASPGNARTANYIKKQFKDMGLSVTEEKVEDDRISQHEYTNFLTTHSDASVNKADLTNVVGVLKGGDLAHEVVVLGAHYDSINLEDTASSAPGVDDNGSGTALMLAAARLLTGLGEKFRPRRSVMFVAFNAEEEGLVGSEHFAQLFRKNGPGSDKYGDLKAVFIVDEVAWPGRGREQRQATFETVGHSPGTTAMVDTLAKMALVKNKTSSVAGDGLGNGTHNFLVNYNGFGSDHISFLDEGIPAVLLIERDNDFHADTWGHSARDTFEHVDMTYGASMSRLALRTVAAFANPIA